MRAKALLITAWLIVAVIQLTVGTLDTLKWRSDPELLRMGFTWADSYIPHGILAAVTAAALFGTNRVATWVALIASSLFGLYYAAYLVFGGEGAFWLRVVVPLMLLCLTGVTMRGAVLRLRAGRTSPPQSH